jgi:hypothetical protein
MINKKLLLLCIGLIMTTQMIFSQVPSYVPSNGLVGYWPFNGNANDQTPNGNNGTVNGASLTTDRFGNANSAYDFDGLNSEIIVPNNPSLNLENPNQFTFSYWINVATLLPTGISFVIIKQTDFGLIQDGYNSGVEYLYSSSCRIQNGPSSSSLAFGSLANTIPTNSWIFVCQVWDGNHGKTYLNNILVNDVVGSAVAGDNLADLRFGKPIFTSSSGGGFDGKIDDIGIWNRALSQQEITNMYNGVNYSDTCNAVSGSLVNGLVAYYPFCGNANDQSGNGLNGVVNGATLTADRFGNSNSAYNFNGTSDFIKVLDNDLLDLTQNLTLSAWISPNSVVNEQAVFGKGKISSQTGYSLLHNVLIPEKTGISIQNQPMPVSEAHINSSTLNLNTWYQLLGTYNGSELKLYLNGVLVKTTTTSLQLMPNSLTDLFIGCELSGFRFFNGKIDDVGIWNRALSQQEITQLFNQNQCTTNITVTDTLIINVGQLSYTNPVTYANNITIYPNPANTQVNISFNNITDLTGGNINIVNSLGQQVATTPITLSGTNTTMPLNSWGGTGLYFVQILNAQGIVVDVKKIILQ